jgi:hypothetical protein
LHDEEHFGAFLRGFAEKGKVMAKENLRKRMDISHDVIEVAPGDRWIDSVFKCCEFVGCGPAAFVRCHFVNCQVLIHKEHVSFDGCTTNR